MTFSFVIPTKNRLEELKTIFNSILSQTLHPNQVIVIDQSEPSNLDIKYFKEIIAPTNINLLYIHDQSIKGLVNAKSASLKHNKCDIISFFDDDIVLMPDYLFEISKAFKNNKLIMGANGIIINRSEVNNLNNLLFNFFHIGLFRDNRQSISFEINDSSLCSVNTLSGGLSTWRKEVFENVSFDTKNMFHAYEDKEFSIRVGRTFPNQMYIIPSAKLYHYHSPGNRQSLLKRTMSDVVEVIMLFKKNGDFSYFGFDLFMLLFGLFLNSILLSFKFLNINFLLNYLKGLNEGRKRKIIC